VVLGLDTGIRRISEFNMLLAITLLVFVLAFGPTVFLLQTLVQNTGMYLSNLFAMTFNLYAYEPGSWVGGWTLFYWGWWIAWSPFVGMFIARISRGRTIREFVVGVLLVPVGFTFMWMTFFGGSALYQVMVQGEVGLAAAVSQDTAVALFQFLEGFPLSGLVSGLATLLVVTFFVTSSDSGSLVVDMLTSRGKGDSPVWRRVFWALMEGVIAAVLLLAGGLAALQTAAIASALPFAIVMLAMCWGLQRALWIDATKRSSLRPLQRIPVASESTDWQQRLRKILHHPDLAEVERFLEQTVQPALQQVAEELRRQHRQVRTGADENGAHWIEVGHGEETDFYYAVRPHALLSPRFSLLDASGDPTPTQRHYRAEVHLREGGQNYDLMGRSREGVIHDVLDQYQQHLGFLADLRHR
jgi:choline/glycine/proline betaine transport protein